MVGGGRDREEETGSDFASKKGSEVSTTRENENLRRLGCKPNIPAKRAQKIEPKAAKSRVIEQEVTAGGGKE